MRFDETLESANRLWHEVSVIVFLHAVALALAIGADLIALHALIDGSGDMLTGGLSSLRDSLQPLGLDVAWVIGLAAVCYIVVFQRLSATVIQLPCLRLRYNQVALWRAGKCFDALRDLIRWFEGYTQSAALVDLEVTLALATTQYSKEFPEHYRELVGNRFTAAGVWAKYYSGFCLLFLAALAFSLLERASPLPPLGLLLCAVIARCGWEAEIERAIDGRLNFAIDCAVVSGQQRLNRSTREPNSEPLSPPELHADRARFEGRASAPWRLGEPGPPSDEALTARTTARLLEQSALDFALGAELLQLPPPLLPYHEVWLLHYVRCLGPWKGLGKLNLIPNWELRAWLEEVRTETERRMSPLHAASSAAYAQFGDDSAWHQVMHPTPAPDVRWRARVLRTRPMVYGLRVLGLLAFVDDPAHYLHTRPPRPAQPAWTLPFLRWLRQPEVARWLKRTRGRGVSPSLADQPGRDDRP